MLELAKWAWFILLIILFCGTAFLYVIAAEVVVIGLIAWLKPEWLKGF